MVFLIPPRKLWRIPEVSLYGHPSLGQEKLVARQCRLRQLQRGDHASQGGDGRQRGAKYERKQLDNVMCRYAYAITLSSDDHGREVGRGAIQTIAGNKQRAD